MSEFSEQGYGPGDVVNLGPGDRFVVAVPESVETAAWYPEPGAKGRPTQVHLMFRVPALAGEAPVVIRFKGPATLDQLIDSLARLRNEVFGVRGLPPAGGGAGNPGRNRPRRPGHRE